MIAGRENVTFQRHGSNVRFGSDANTMSMEDLNRSSEDGELIRAQLKRANETMKNVYLQTPYKVLAFRQVSKKKDNQQSPVKLYRAENSLRIHTVLRESFYQQHAASTLSVGSQKVNAFALANQTAGP